METNQNQGERLFRALLAAFNVGVEAVVDLFDKEAVVHYPYASSMGAPADHLNMENYRTHLQRMLPDMPGIQFTDVRVYPVQDGAGYWAEVHGETNVPATGHEYRQDYVMYFTMKADKFGFYREYWNPIPSLRAFGGAAPLTDVNAPAN